MKIRSLDPEKARSRRQRLAAAPAEEISAPNISLNLHQGTRIGDLWFAASCGMVLQFGVLIFSGFAVYYPIWNDRFQKDEKAVAGYAFPLLSGGTVLVTLGMIICSAVIEKSTTETKWSIKRRAQRQQPVADPADVLAATSIRKRHVPGVSPRLSMESLTARKPAARVLWLQKTHVVSDQTFDSFVIFAKGTRNKILSSRRYESEEILSLSARLNRENSRGRSESWLATRAKKITSSKYETFTILGSTFTIIGFILQFEGQRGMNWTTSIAQLLVVMVMTFLRAWIRRGLVQKPNAAKVPDRHEMDWLALRFSMESGFWENHSGSLDDGHFDEDDEGERSQRLNTSWSIATQAENIALRGIWAPENQSPTKQMPDAHKVMKVRQRLGRLSQWVGPAGKQAVALANSIEAAMGAFFVAGIVKKPRPWHDREDSAEFMFETPPSVFVWSLAVDLGTTRQSCEFTVRLIDGKWKADATELEAALSLWLYTINERQKALVEKVNSRFIDARQKARVDASSSADPIRMPEVENTDWLRQDNALRNNCYRVLGRASKSLSRDLGLFVDSAFAPQSSQSMQEISRAGFLCFGFCGFELPSGSFDRGNNVIGTYTTSSLKYSLAQHIFSGFMWAVTKQIPARFLDDSPITVRKSLETNGPTSWSASKFHIEALDQLVLKLEGTGLGSSDEMMLSLIPPMSDAKLLPVEKLVSVARDDVKVHEEKGNWDDACQIYRNVLQSTQALDLDDRYGLKAHAVVDDFGKLVNARLGEFREKDVASKRETKVVEDVSNSISQQISAYGNPVALSRLEEFNRLIQLDAATHDPESSVHGTPAKTSTCDVTDMSLDRKIELSRLFRLTPLHENILFDPTHDFRVGRQYLNATDLLDRTPLHYAVARGVPDNLLYDLMSEGPDANAADMGGNTPLHYARTVSVGHLLINMCGADPHARNRSGYLPIHYAARYGEPALVELYVNEGVALLPTANSRYTALHMAARGNNAGAVRILLQAHVDVNAKDNDGWTPLHIAASRDHSETVEVLLENKVDRDAIDGQGFKPIHYAEKNRAIKTWGLLLESELGGGGDNGERAIHLVAQKGMLGAALAIYDPKGTNNRDGVGRTPLHHAALGGHADVLEALVTAGANIDEADDDDETPLFTAVEEGKLEVVELLLKLGAGLEIANEEGITPLLVACRENQLDIAERLIEAGANLQARDGSGRTAVNIAAGEGEEGVIQFLLDRRVDCNLADKYGISPMHAVINATIETANSAEDGESRLNASKCISIISLLARHRANLNPPDWDLFTPLHRACDSVHGDPISLHLIKLGADTDARTSHNWTPLHFVSKRHDPDVVRVLLECGANPNVQGRDGQTPLYEAAWYGNFKVARELMKAGADKHVIGLFGLSPLEVAIQKGWDRTWSALEQETRDGAVARDAK